MAKGRRSERNTKGIYDENAAVRRKERYVQQPI